VLYQRSRLLIKVSAELKVMCFLIRYFSYTQNVGGNFKTETENIRNVRKLIELFKRLGLRNQLITIVIVLLIINFIVTKNISLGYVEDLEGHIQSPHEVKNAGFNALFLGIPFISFLLGISLSIFLPKNKSYNKGLLNSSLIILIVCYLIVLILGIRNLILW